MLRDFVSTLIELALVERVLNLLAIVFAGKSFERGFDDAATEAEDQVEG